MRWTPPTYPVLLTANATQDIWSHSLAPQELSTTAVSTSSTHAEAFAIFTLVKEVNFLIALL